MSMYDIVPQMWTTPMYQPLTQAVHENVLNHWNQCDAMYRWSVLIRHNNIKLPGYKWPGLWPALCLEAVINREVCILFHTVTAALLWADFFITTDSKWRSWCVLCTRSPALCSKTRTFSLEKLWNLCSGQNKSTKTQKNAQTIHVFVCVSVYFKIVNRHIYQSSVVILFACGERQLQNARAHQSKNKSKASWHAALLSVQNSLCIPDAFSILIISVACSWHDQSQYKLWLCVHWVEATHTLCTVGTALLTTTFRQLWTCAFYSNVSSSLAGNIMLVTWCLQVQVALRAMLRTHTIEHISLLWIKQQQQLQKTEWK